VYLSRKEGEKMRWVRFILLLMSIILAMPLAATELDDYRQALGVALSEGQITREEYQATLARIPDIQAAQARIALAEARRTLNSMKVSENGTIELSTEPQDGVDPDVPRLWPLLPRGATATLNKPYSTFEFEGQTFSLENLSGGHNGRVALACKASPPVFNPERGVWEIKLSNNLIHFDVPTPAGLVQITSIPLEGSGSEGVFRSRDGRLPAFPAESLFEVQLKAQLPDGRILTTRQPLELKATNIASWPPPPGTAYRNENSIFFYAPDSPSNAQPVIVIRPDTTVLKEVLEVVPSPGPAQPANPH
jgi:hypothetical protein